MFGLAYWKAIDSFRRDVGFSADAHRHQVPFGFLFKQVGLWFIHPLSLGSSPPLSLGWIDFTPHQALPFPFVHQTLSVSLLWFHIYYDLLLTICSADPYEKNRLKYKYCQLLVVLSWCEDRPTLGRDSAHRAWARRHGEPSCFMFVFHEARNNHYYARLLLKSAIQTLSNEGFF